MTKQTPITKPQSPSPNHQTITNHQIPNTKRLVIGSWLLGIVWLLEVGHWLLPDVTYAEATNRIVALVNEDIITEWDVRVRMSALLEEDEEPPHDRDEASEFRHAVLTRLIEERLIVQEAKRLGLTVETDEVMERLQTLRREFAPRERYEAMLQDAQLTEEQLKTKLREQLLMQRAIDQKIRLTIVISPAELRASDGTIQPADPPSNPPEDDVLAAHLLIRFSDKRSVEQARQRIDRLFQRLLSGEAFEPLATEQSEGPHAQEGGHLGWVKPGEMLPELAEALSQLKPGEVSEPIQSDLGFHLVKVLDRRQAQPADPEGIRDAAYRRLYQGKFANAMRAWLEDLRQQAYIQVMDE
jgi:peptidyl-prolyl cis-trans isomerase SurA